MQHSRTRHCHFPEYTTCRSALPVPPSNLPCMKDAKMWLLTLSLLPLTLEMNATSLPKEGRTEPAIQGVVSDASTRKPVKGVTIWIRSGNSPLQLITDESGNFRLPSLPKGQVTLVLEKKGYKTYRREGIVLKEGMIININLDTQSDATEEGEIFHPLQRIMDGF